MQELNLRDVLRNLNAKLLRQEHAVKETRAHIAALELLQKTDTKK